MHIVKLAGHAWITWILYCRCSELGAISNKLFHVHPAMVGAFAGSALHSGNLLTGSGERTWYDIELLEYLRLHRKNNPRMAIDSFTQTMAELHSRNGEPSHPRDTVRKQLGRTLNEYENVMFQRERTVCDIAEGPSLIDCCPACTGAHRERGDIPGHSLRREGTDFKLA